MQRIFLTSLGLAAMAGLTGEAVGADIGRLPPRAAPAYVAPYYNWTGAYVGINGGGSWGSSSWTGFSNFNVSGGVVGGTLGYNWQFGQVVAGLEGDIDWSNIRGNGICTFTCQTKNDWLGTLRGRLGYAMDRLMPYVTGGLAFGDIKATSALGTSTTSNAGWTIGAGVEYALAPNWSAKAEYLYVDLGNLTCTTCNVTTTTVGFTSNIVRAGLNVRF